METSSLRPLRIAFVLAAGAGIVAIACGGSDSEVGSSSGSTPDAGPRGVEPTGQECTTPSQCYDDVDGGADGGAISGQVVCITKITNGYCTHTCNDDSDCCKAPGECKTGLKHVCASLENQPEKYCFLSCETEDVNAGTTAQAADGGYDGGAPDGGSREDAYCKAYSSTQFGCRSTGGGNKNRKACLP
jgi:hypothetical protein